MILNETTLRQNQSNYCREKRKRLTVEYLIRDDILVKYTEEREKKQVVIPDEIREIGD